MCEKKTGSLGNFFHTEKDKGKEKHAPVIYCPQKVSPEETFEVKISIGEEIPHPNTWEHHIKWIQVYVKEEDGEPIHAASFDLGPTIAEPKVIFSLKLKKSATIYAIDYCNIHGLWESKASITVAE